jgi:hypothetical protein
MTQENRWHRDAVIFHSPLHIALPAIAITLFFAASSSQWAWAQGRTDTIVQTGQAAPDANGTFLNFVNPVLNDSGQAAFFAVMAGTSGGITDDTGIFRGSGGSITQIARAGQAAPDSNGTFQGFFSPVFNDLGQAAFNAYLTGTSGVGTDDGGIFLGSGGSITQIAREGQAAPGGNGTFSSFDLPVINNSGQAAFFAFLTGTTGGGADDSGIFRGSGGSITQIARAGQAAPDANGTFSAFGGNPVLNDSGQAAFFAGLTGTSGGGTDNTGIFRGSGGSITQIAREGQAAPDANGTFSNFFDPVLNDLGQAAFLASLTGTSGGGTDNTGIFRGSGGSLTQIARAGQAAPDANGTFSGFGNPVLNDSGQAAFSAFLTGTSGGGTDNSGIFRGSGGSLTQIARKGQTAPDANGTFSNFFDPVLNNSGQAAFTAFLTGTSGGGTDNSGIFTGDGIDFLQVVRTGDSLAGSTVTSASLGSDGLNQHGQIAYLATLANGNEVVRRWTPDLHWRASFSSTWDTSARWTLGLNPAQVHDVFIDPAASLTVTGPAADTTVRSLRIGGGTGLATLNLRNGAVLTATSGVTVENKGTLTGDGVIGGNVVNRLGGTVLASNVTITGSLTNQGTLRGSGQVDARIVNASGGRIRALGGDQLVFGGTQFDNSGLVEIHDSELVSAARLTNRSGTGLISLQTGSLIADAGITNVGSMAITAGLSNIQGDVTNTGTIQVSGGAQATFFDDVTQNGVMQVASVGSTNSTAVILGAFTGSGGFVGGGDVFALGDLRPGNSPDSVLYDGNLFLGSSTDTFIELGGLNLGEFDQMLVSGDLNLGGDLFVSLIDGHTLGASEFYLIGDVGGSLMGQFNGLGEGDFVGNFGGRDLFITYSGGNGNNGIGLFTAVPEPGAAGLLGGLLLGWISQRRRRVRLTAQSG